jgi:hypothetical protein
MLTGIIVLTQLLADGGWGRGGSLVGDSLCNYIRKFRFEVFLGATVGGGIWRGAVLGFDCRLVKK